MILLCNAHRECERGSPPKRLLGGSAPPATWLFVQTRSQGAITSSQTLWTALERNARWIKQSISCPDSLLQEHLRWLFERLKDRIPANASDEELDQMVRLEVTRIWGRFRDRFKSNAPFPGEITDPAGQRFESDLEDKNELRESLECVSAETRELILKVFTATEDEKRSKNTRTRLAARLGLTRNALDQRISRAYSRIRERMSGKRGSKKP
jgi:hypothetical protein